MTADLKPQEVSERLASGEIQLIDVRAQHEHEAGRIAGDRLLELSHLASEAHTIDRERPVVATQAFAQAGFDAHNLAGGLVDWTAAGLPIEPEGGYVANP